MAKLDHVEPYIDEFRSKGGGARQRVVRLLGGKIDEHRAAFRKEHLQFEDEDEGPQLVDIIATGTCSFGHTVDDKVRAAGICEIGGEVLCSTEGCVRHCSYCGIVVCARHSKISGDRTYCNHCRWRHYWHIFWRS